MRDNRPPKFINLVISLECVLLAAFLILLSPVGTVISDSIAVSGQVSEKTGKNGNEDGSSGNSKSKKQDFIKWVDFQVTKEAMQQAFRYDVDTCQSDIHLNWIELLAYLGARYGGDFSRYKAADMKTVADRVMGGEKMEDITKDMKYYPYYLEAYGAVLGGMVGEFRVQIPAAEAPEFALEEHREDGKQQAGDGENGGENPNMEDGKPQEKNGDDGKVWVTKYGLKAFSPIARNYPYNDYDDFGAARSYGFKRQHLGHDMMGQVGTPNSIKNYIDIQPCYNS